MVETGRVVLGSRRVAGFVFVNKCDVVGTLASGPDSRVDEKRVSSERVVLYDALCYCIDLRFVVENQPKYGKKCASSHILTGSRSIERLEMKML